MVATFFYAYYNIFTKQNDKGKFVERRRRKATGLRPHGYGRRVTEVQKNDLFCFFALFR